VNLEVHVLKTLASPEDRTHLVGRLEAFSDIIFGFSISQLASILKIPDTGSALITQLPNFLLFCITFMLLCAICWSHYRLFRYFFVANRLDVVMNFILLALVALVTYSLQMAFQLKSTYAVGWQCYFANMAGIFGLMSALYFRGLGSQEPSQQLKGGTVAFTQAGMTLLFIVAGMTVFLGAKFTLSLILLAPVVRLVAQRLAQRMVYP